MFGAIFLDGGYAAARRAVVQAFGPLLEALDPGKVEKDAKTRLQELLQARGRKLPEYRVVATRGRAAQAVFEVECVVDPGVGLRRHRQRHLARSAPSSRRRRQCSSRCCKA